jgi:tetratricopeptide (TPR) repeat protein
MQVKSYFFLLFSFISFIAFPQSDVNLEPLFNLEISADERAKVNDKIFEFSQQIKEEPDNYMNYYNRGVMYGRLGLHPDAITDYNKAIQLKSDFPQAYYNRGLSRARFGYTKTACADIKKSAELGLDQAATTYKNKCGLYFGELGELP